MSQQTESQNSTKNFWQNPTIVAALIGAVALIIVTAMSIIFKGCNDENHQTQTTVKPSAIEQHIDSGGVGAAHSGKGDININR